MGPKKRPPAAALKRPAAAAPPQPLSPEPALPPPPVTLGRLHQLLLPTYLEFGQAECARSLAAIKELSEALQHDFDLDVPEQSLQAVSLRS